MRQINILPPTEIFIHGGRSGEEGWRHPVAARHRPARRAEQEEAGEGVPASAAPGWPLACREWEAVGVEAGELYRGGELGWGVAPHAPHAVSHAPHAPHAVSALHAPHAVSNAPHAVLDAPHAVSRAPHAVNETDRGRAALRKQHGGLEWPWRIDAVHPPREDPMVLPEVRAARS